MIYDTLERDARDMASRAKNGTLKIEGVTYFLTFDHERWSYDVTTRNGDDFERVVTFNTKKITEARRWLREYLGV